MKYLIDIMKPEDLAQVSYVCEPRSLPGLSLRSHTRSPYKTSVAYISFSEPAFI
jgi:hypothetical protein